MNETYIKVKGRDRYLYRAIDSTGQTIDFLLAAKRDAAAAKRFLRKALHGAGNSVPRVINVDQDRSVSGGRGKAQGRRQPSAADASTAVQIFEQHS